MKERTPQPTPLPAAPNLRVWSKSGGRRLNPPHQDSQTQPRTGSRPLPIAPAGQGSSHTASFEKSTRGGLKAKRRTPADQTRLYMNVGEEMNIAPEDIVKAILGETGLPREVVGTVDVRERHLFVDVASDHVSAIIAKLNRSSIKGRRIKVKTA